MKSYHILNDIFKKWLDKMRLFSNVNYSKKIVYVNDKKKFKLEF